MKAEITGSGPISEPVYCALKYQMPDHPKAIYSIPRGHSEAQITKVGIQFIRTNRFENNPSFLGGCQRFIANKLWNQLPIGNSQHKLWGWGRTLSGEYVLVNKNQVLQAIGNRENNELIKFRQFTAGFNASIFKDIEKHRGEFYQNLRDVFSENQKQIIGLDTNYENPSFPNVLVPKSKFDEIVNKIAKPNDFIPKFVPPHKNFIDKKLENLSPTQTLSLGAAAGCLATAAVVLLTRKNPRGFSKFAGSTQRNSASNPVSFSIGRFTLPPVLPSLPKILGFSDNREKQHHSNLNETSKQFFEAFFDELGSA